MNNIRLSFALIFFGNSVLLFAENSGYEALLNSKPPKVQSFDYIEESIPKIDFGYVDFKTLLLFHPAMRMYNFKVNNFYRPLPDKLNTPLKFYLENRERKSIKKVKDAKTERALLDRQLLKLHKKKSRVLGDFAEQKRLLLLDRFVNTEQELIKLNEEQQNEIAQLESEINKITSAMQSLYNQSFGVHYLNLDERKSMLKKIESEVKQVIEAIRQKKKLTFILNNQVGDLTKAFQPNPMSFEYEGFVEMNKLWTFLNRVPDTWSDSAGIRVEQDVVAFSEFYSKHHNIGSIFRLESINRLVLAGGSDLTYECLAELYIRYKYPQNQIVRLINILEGLKTEAN